MNILLTNDDGILAEGLWSLYHQLSEKHSVTVAAPDRERSAVGHGITLRRVVNAVKVDLGGGRRGYATNGTPADCVKMGVGQLTAVKPDIVISGINPGSNTGINVNYSGTVAAAREGALMGLSSIAVSIQSTEPEYYTDAALFVERLIHLTLQKQIPAGTFLNVNIPNIPLNQIKGVRAAIQSQTNPYNPLLKAVGADVNRNSLLQKKPMVDSALGGRDDESILNENCISITPIKCDATDHDIFQDIKGWEIECAV